MTNRLPDFGRSRDRRAPLPQTPGMAVERFNELFAEFGRRLRDFLGRHREYDTTLADAHADAEESLHAFDPNAFEHGPDRKWELLLLRMGSLLQDHPLAGEFIRGLLDEEARVRSRAIHLLRQKGEAN